MSADLLSRELDRWEAKLAEAHREYRRIAQTDAQKAGHLAEGSWVKLTKQILPPSYRVYTRRYMGREVDIVVLPPSAPSFYDDAEVADIPPTVASAVIQVKNTLDKPQLRDSMKRVAQANADEPNYRPSRDQERLGLPAAIVALGSNWKGGFESFTRAFHDILEKDVVAHHPSQVPGFVCTPEFDLRCHSFDMSAVPEPYRPAYQNTDSRWQVPHVVLGIAASPTGHPVHAYAQWLYSVCAASDPSLEAMRVATNQLFDLNWTSFAFPYELKAVYSPYWLSHSQQQ